MSDYQEVIITSMQQKRIEHWEKKKKKQRASRRILVYASAAIICFAAGAVFITKTPASVSVMNHIDTGFDYDETLGRLQYVSNILPESAMVFLDNSKQEMQFTAPVNSQLLHVWNPGEPWMEYSGVSDVTASQGGEVAAVVKNRNGEYTVRMLHEDGYETIYSGLTSVLVNESDILQASGLIGQSKQKTAFELRKDGISILPVFENQ